MKQLHFVVAAIGSIFILASCEKERNDVNPDSKEGASIVIGTNLKNPDGLTGSTYLQLIDDSNEWGRKIDNSKAYPINFGSAYPQAIGNDIFVFPSFKNESKDELVKYTVENGVLRKSGVLKLLAKSYANNIVKVSDEKAYLSLPNYGHIWIFNPATMEKTGDINLESLSIDGDNNPDPSIMIARDGILFVALSQWKGGFLSPQKQCDIALIDLKTDKLIKKITDTAGQFSQPTRPYDAKSMFMDEKGDIYLSCVGNFGFTEGHKAGVLRIRKGETEFDQTYHWTITDAPVTGDINTGDKAYISTMYYWKNGKGYGYIDMSSHHRPGETTLTAISNRAVELDFYNKTLKKIDGLELSTGFGICVAKYKDGKIAIGNSSKNIQGIFSLDPSTNTVSDKPMIIPTGEPVSFDYFGK